MKHLVAPCVGGELHEIGADGYAPDAQVALSEAERMVQ